MEKLTGKTYLYMQFTPISRNTIVANKTSMQILFIWTDNQLIKTYFRIMTSKQFFHSAWFVN